MMGARENLSAGQYENRVSYSIAALEIDESTTTIAGARDLKAQHKATQRQQCSLHNQEQGRISAQVKSDLEAEHGLAGHPKADILWSKAWDHGHSSGYDEIISVYEDLAELLQHRPRTGEEELMDEKIVETVESALRGFEAAWLLETGVMNASGKNYETAKARAAIEAHTAALAAAGFCIQKGWSPITDAQKDGTEYLIGWFELPGHYQIEAAFWHSTHGAWSSGTRLFARDPANQPTHWRPLPDAPDPR